MSVSPVKISWFRCRCHLKQVGVGSRRRQRNSVVAEGAVLENVGDFCKISFLKMKYITQNWVYGVENFVRVFSEKKCFFWIHSPDP